jgi:predicted NBD/HSP70 family sugar kinase
MVAAVPLVATAAPPLWAIGLDVGGTKIAGGLVAIDSGEVRDRLVIPTNPERGGAAVLADAATMATDLAATASARGDAISGVGIAVAELVDVRGQVRSAHRIAWREVPVADRFTGIAPATVESDVRAAALAEARYGSGWPFALFAYITVGTGISSCLVQDGRPYAGARGGALVLASGALSVPCDGCGAETRFILEEFAAGPALVSRYNARSSYDVTRAEEVLAKATEGDTVAAEIAGSAADALGSSTGFLVNLLDPEAIIVGGGLGLAMGLYRERFVTATRRHVWNAAARDLPILSAGLGVDAALIGAAAASVVRAGDLCSGRSLSRSREGR